MDIDGRHHPEIGISCYVADNPLECVAMGTGIALDHLELIKRSMPAEGEWLVSFSLSSTSPSAAPTAPSKRFAGAAPPLTGELFTSRTVSGRRPVHMCPVNSSSR